MTFRTFTAALAAAVLLAAPALAQTPPAASAPATPDDLTDEQFDELYCIYDGLSTEDTDPILDFRLRGQAKSEAAAKKLYADAKAECTDDYKWTPRQAEVAEAVGSAAIITDLIGEIFAGKGIGEAKIDTLFEFGGTLSNDDINNLVLFEPSKEEAWQNGMKKRIADSGFSTDDEALRMALAWLRFTYDEFIAGMIWIEDKLY